MTIRHTALLELSLWVYTYELLATCMPGVDYKEIMGFQGLSFGAERPLYRI